MKAKSYNLKARGGFTLIELLVVIAIISLLSSIVLASLGQAKKKAQYAQIKANLVQVIKALEIYYLDTGAFPHQCIGLGLDILEDTCWWYGDQSGPNSFAEGLKELTVGPNKSISSLPKSPFDDLTYVYDIEHITRISNSDKRCGGILMNPYYIGVADWSTDNKYKDLIEEIGLYSQGGITFPHEGCITGPGFGPCTEIVSDDTLGWLKCQ